MNFIRIWLILSAAMLVCWQGISSATERINITIGLWSFEEHAADNLNLEFMLTGKGLGVVVSADSMTLAEPIGQLKKVSLKCTELTLLSEHYSCKQGTVAFQHAELGAQKLHFSVKAQLEISRYDIQIAGLKLAEAEISFTAKLDKENWQVSLDIPRVSLTQLVELTSPYLAKEKIEQLSEWSYGADLAITAELQGQATQLGKANIALTASSLNFSDSQGLHVAEDSALNLIVDLAQTNEDWQWHAALNIASGQAYADPIFLDFSASPLSFNVDGRWQQQSNKLSIQRATIIHQDIAELDFELISDFTQLKELNLTLKQSDISKLYPIWLQPFLVDTAAANLELAGQLAMQFKLKNDDYQLTVDLTDLFVDDKDGLFGLYDLNGTLGWTNTIEPLTSQITWQGGYVYAIPVGASTIVAQSKLSQLNLQQTWTLPILDGELQLNGFSFQRPENDNVQWTFDGLLTPISMESLSSALEWPTLHGKLSGVIPKVSYVDHNIHVDGALLVKLFDGTTIIRELQLDQPFGALPQLYANVDINNLDLETLTQTFDFGKITGKLDGQINQLRLSNWQPVAFDAHFYTPVGDKSRRRISQKAVDNLSQIGGGAGGLLSRSFLRFFEDFSYQRLGLSCKLTNEVCEMTGVSEAEHGYYIVKGGGLPPRINVVGYTRRVDWPDLIERLKSVSQSSGPVIQ
ncbi:hypothetical protein A9Q79_03000 [Methylophaga sp. 42_25_T18]|nr:hypothetical protein A9Q79_03000 [Methylophaga sp. 42_25_T18]OUR87684.1 hypothetical protein A9Q92_04030 [Methylophaga sp. 42_8_T64]